MDGLNSETVKKSFWPAKEAKNTQNQSRIPRPFGGNSCLPKRGAGTFSTVSQTDVGE